MSENRWDKDWRCDSNSTCIYAYDEHDEPTWFVAQVHDQRTRALVLASPVLYRALASVESIATDAGNLCPSCFLGAEREDDGGLVQPHAPDCALNAALKQARGET